MVLFVILTIITAGVLAFATALIGTLGTIGIIIGGDLIVAMFIVWFLFLRGRAK